MGINGHTIGCNNTTLKKNVLICFHWEKMCGRKTNFCGYDRFTGEVNLHTRKNHFNYLTTKIKRSRSIQTTNFRKHTNGKTWLFPENVHQKSDTHTQLLLLLLLFSSFQMKNNEKKKPFLIFDPVSSFCLQSCMHINIHNHINK